MEMLESGEEADIFLDGTIYKLFKKPETSEKLANTEDVALKFLASKGYHVPLSKGLFKKGQRVGLMMDYISGGTLEEELFYKEGYGEEVGKILSKLHIELHNLDCKDLPNSIPHVYEKFKTAAVKVGLTEILKPELILRESLAHGDFHPANVIHNTQKNIVIDWSRAFIGPAEADIATTLVLLMRVQPPGDATDSVREIFKNNVKEVLRVYLREYNSQVQLDRQLVEKWIRLVASVYPNDIELNPLIEGKFNLPWPESSK
jgi:tRNA A-37 threonylcarbamoyl transferase component Bud32